MTIQQPASLFGRRLRSARHRADIPQDKLGVQIGLDEHTASARISRYETGVHEPPFEIALKLAEALRVPAAYFYCDDDGLAELVLAWGSLSTSERKKLKKLAQTPSNGNVDK
ncbi:helix-turn-helix protein [Paraburkholderia sp. BL27I4N3]|uniref:helix-turn-helix domain-containing protein n=1 Tax=Paraburkholderia sp. BL27I4N3 TaxID=1938805 RepID=UPI000E2886DA|nr:helix-turn-helix transcriptional regulator [Paraburkholderia sp. BL27I4N3]REE17721.1 helix-turn-helix protein [Paraburkholderia sp. BL27I4N3]